MATGFSKGGFHAFVHFLPVGSRYGISAEPAFTGVAVGCHRVGWRMGCLRLGLGQRRDDIEKPRSGAFAVAAYVAAGTAFGVDHGGGPAFGADIADLGDVERFFVFVSRSSL